MPHLVTAVTPNVARRRVRMALREINLGTFITEITVRLAASRGTGSGLLADPGEAGLVDGAEGTAEDLGGCLVDAHPLAQSQ